MEREEIGPRSTRSRPSLPPAGIPSTSSSSSSSRPDGDHNSPQSANAIAHAQYTASLSGLGKKDRGRAGSRKKSSGQDGAERMDTDTDDNTPHSSTLPIQDLAVDEAVKDEDTDADGARALARAASDGLDDGRADDRAREAAVTVVVRPPSSEQDDNQQHQQSEPQPEEDEEDESGDEEEEEGADVTRCVCGITESDDMMIQCDTCNVWQHGACVGIPTEEETPDEYFCEKCQPGLHVALKKWMKSMSRGRGGIFLPPSASDLQRLNPDDKVPPNQSKRWTHDLPNLPPLDGHDSDSESDRGGGRGRRSRSNRNRSKQPSASVAPAPSSATTASSASAPKTSHRPLPFPPRKTTGSTPAATTPSAVAGPSSAGPSSSHHGSYPPSSGHPPSAKSHKRQVSSSSNQHAVSHRQLSPIAPSSSQSPPPAKLKSPKKRSTMNSRDAGLEEAIRESLLAAGGLPEDEKPGSSRRSPSSNGSIRDRSEPAEKRAAGTKRGRRASVESSAGPTEAGGTAGRKGKKAKKDVALLIDPSIPDSPSSHPPPSSSAKGDHPDHHGYHKAKHPNQYTYRPKTSPSSAAFPEKPMSSQPAVASSSKEHLSPSKPVKEKVSHASLSSAAHEHGTRRHGGPSSGGGSNGNGGGSGGRSSTPANGAERAERSGGHGRGEGSGTGTSTPTWGIPDHLSHLSALLPSIAPQPLLIGVNAPDPDPSTSSAPPSSHLKPFVTAPRQEPPTKIKWPGKRMTVGEMRKRVRAILDFVGRWPVGDRPLPLPASMLKDLNGEPRKTRAEEVEELVRDLISFEQRFGSASFGTSGLRSGGDVPGMGLGSSGVPTTAVVAPPPVVETVVAVEDAEMIDEEKHVEFGGVVLQVEEAPTTTLTGAVVPV